MNPSQFPLIINKKKNPPDISGANQLIHTYLPPKSIKITINQTKAKTKTLEHLTHTSMSGQQVIDFTAVLTTASRCRLFHPNALHHSPLFSPISFALISSTSDVGIPPMIVIRHDVTMKVNVMFQRSFIMLSG